MEETSASVPGLEIKLVGLFVLLSATLLFGSAPLCFIRGTGRWSTNPGKGGCQLSVKKTTIITITIEVVSNNNLVKMYTLACGSVPQKSDTKY